MKAKVVKITRSLVVLGLAIGIAAALIKLKPKPQKQPPPPASLLVEVMQVKASSPAMVVKSYGTVRPSESLKLVSEVKGKVVEMAPTFEEGGFFRKGELLIRIDPRSYELAVAQRKKQIKQLDAELRRLDQERANLEISQNIARSDVELAKAELERFKVLAKRGVVAQSNLDQAEQKYLASRNRMLEIENQVALIDPRGDGLRAQRELVEVRLKEALLDLDRTRIKAPFHGWVLEKGVEKEQFVNAGASLGRVYRASALEVEVRIPFKDLLWLGEARLASDPTKGNIGKAKVIFNSSGQTHTWEGRVVRIKAAVDEKTRTLPLIIEVPASYPLKPGMFVDVELTGRKIDKAYLLPRSAIHPGNLVCLAENNHLVIRPVEVLRRLNDSVYVGEGLTDGDLVITTPISVPKEGMKLRLSQTIDD
jgi:multidrug efflux pump subunit AcrA (membrane-fusion protein)